MSSEDPDRAGARPNDAGRAANEASTFKHERDVAAKAVLDNMAKLKALRLAREAAAPSAAAKTTRAKSSARNKSPAKKTAAEKAPALADWLAGQQNGGHRT
jgi:hypothetical protein